MEQNCPRTTPVYDWVRWWISGVGFPHMVSRQFHLEIQFYHHPWSFFGLHPHLLGETNHFFLPKCLPHFLDFDMDFDTFQRKHEWSQLRCKMVTAVASCGSISQTETPTISGWNGPWAGRWLLDLKTVVQKLQTQGKDMKKLSLVVVGCCWYVSMQFSDVQFRTILHQTVLFFRLDVSPDVS